MTTITVAKAGRDFAGTLRHVTTGREAVALKRGRRTVAVMLPPDMIEAIEDLEDVRAADAALARHEKDPSQVVNLDEYVRRREAKTCGTR